MPYHNLTLGWFVNQTRIDNLEFIGPPSALLKPIAGINVLDNPDGIHWIKKNELVLSTGYIFKDDPEMQKQIIKELSEIDCTAFCIKIKRFFDHIPELMIEEASKYQLPLIAVPFYHSYADIMDVIFHEIERKNLDHRAFILDETEKLYQLLYRKEGITKMLEHLAGLSRSACMITTLSDSVLYYDIPSADEPLFSESQNTGISAVPASRREHNGFRYCTFSFNDKKAEFITFLLPNRNNYLCLHSGHQQPTNQLLQILQHAFPVLALQLENIQQINRYQTNRSYYQSFFNLLSDIHSKSMEEIKSICTSYGFRLEGKKICLTLEADAKLFQRYSFKQLYSDTEYHIKSLTEQAFICFHENRIVIFLFYPHNHPDLAAVNHAIQTATQLYQELPAYHGCLQIGVSRSHSPVQAIAAAYQESLNAIHLQHRLTPEDPIASCFHQTSYMLLEKLGSKELNKLYTDTVAQLVQYDRENGADLLDTLKAFYKCRLNISETSKTLFLHRNTLAARLALIKEILGLPLENFAEIVTIYIGICAYELLAEQLPE